MKINNALFNWRLRSPNNIIEQFFIWLLSWLLVSLFNNCDSKNPWKSIRRKEKLPIATGWYFSWPMVNQNPGDYSILGLSKGLSTFQWISQVTTNRLFAITTQPIPLIRRPGSIRKPGEWLAGIHPPFSGRRPRPSQSACRPASGYGRWFSRAARRGGLTWEPAAIELNPILSNVLIKITDPI